MGRIGAPYGVKGGFHVHSFTDDIGALTQYDLWWIGDESNPVEHRVLECRVHGKGLVARFENVADRDQISLERGKLILIPRDELPEPSQNESYWADIIGLDVFNPKGDHLGSVSGFLETGVQDVLIVSQASVERLIPFVEPLVVEVNLPQRKIIVNWEVDY